MIISINVWFTFYLNSKGITKEMKVIYKKKGDKLPNNKAVSKAKFNYLKYL
jgi:hypothetical protein